MKLSDLDLTSVALFVASCGKLFNSSGGSQTKFLLTAAVACLVILLLTLRSSSEFAESVPHLAFITLNVLIAASKLKGAKGSINYLKTLTCVIGACAVGLALAPLAADSKVQISSSEMSSEMEMVDEEDDSNYTTK